MMKQKILNFIKKEFILSIAIVFMILSCFFVPIDKEYINYIDFNTLICLFCILTVITGLKDTNVFELISQKIIRLFHTRRTVIAALIFCTFFFDMIIANDMSLITFLPLSYIVLHSTSNDKYLAFTFVLQTIAANMGGMISPYGNPQNLYLYSYYGIETLEFFGILFTQFIAALILLGICCLFVKNEPLVLNGNPVPKINKIELSIYIILFILVILTIFRVLPYALTLYIVVFTVLIVDINKFKKVDYALLATFLVFFVFSGNIARIPMVKNFISEIVVNNTLIAGIISCQFISNVPTAVFLSNFTTNYKDLLVSVNIGSLGIMISSLASLITLKEFLKHQPDHFWKYLGLFTLFNVLFLILLVVITVVS